MAIEHALMARRGARKRGDEIDFPCVVHPDDHPSAGWNRKRDVWNCLACARSGTSRDLAKLLNIAIEERPKSQAEIVATYDYLDQDGVLLYQAVRMHPKSFRQRRPDGKDGWVWNLEGTTKVLFRLPELLASTGTVYIVEGEKDVLSLAERGLTATCNAMGAGKWRPAYNESLRGRAVVVLPDNDKAGLDHAEQVARSLVGFAASVKVVRLPGLPPKGDVSDWLLAGGTKGELEELAAAVPEWTPPLASDGTPAGVSGFAETDAGNAELFAHLYGDRCRYDWKRRRWLVWDRHRWVPEATGELIRLAIEAARTRKRAAADLIGEAADRAWKWAKASEGHGKIDAMLKIACAISPISDVGEGWDSNPMILGCVNGVVNLATGEFRDGRKEDRVTRSTGIVFDPMAVAPRWERFLIEVFPDAKVREYVRVAAGYSLTGDTTRQMFFLCHGTGANGKGTFIDALRWVAGEYGHVMAFSTIEKGKEQSIPADMAALVGMRVVTVSEAGEVSRINEERVKGLTGQDPVTARELYSKQFTFTPELKLWIAVNHRPKVGDDSHGFWRRIRLIPFTEQFAVAEDVKGKLREELPGILAWAVRAAVDYRKDGFPDIPAAIALETVSYQEESDELAPFIAERCAVRPDAFVAAGHFYKAYKDWGEGQGYGPRDGLSATMFGRKMAERFKKRKTNTIIEYDGIGLISDGWSPKPSTSGGLSDSVEGFSRKIASENLVRARLLRNEPTNPPHLPLPVLPPCDCASHPPSPACDDETWWQPADGSAHCDIA
ncbi:MAG: toprim domain-containing protein [Chloroflexi bacterium]|nr:toprim domain-containing protein [Chloroflexota bacterium]